MKGCGIRPTLLLTLASCASSTAGPPPSVSDALAATATTVDWSTLSRAERLARAPGTPDHSCVDVDRLRATRSWHTVADGRGGEVPVLDVRAGDFVVGNLYQPSGTGTVGGPDFVAKLYWVPVDPNVAKTATLDLTVEGVDITGGVRHLQVGGDGAYSGNPGDYFWPSGTPLPGRGPWKVTATAPGHWGCIVLSPT